jgi:hypothetical protein
MYATGFSQGILAPVLGEAVEVAYLKLKFYNIPSSLL